MNYANLNIKGLLQRNGIELQKACIASYKPSNFDKMQV